LGHRGVKAFGLGIWDLHARFSRFWDLGKSPFWLSPKPVNLELLTMAIKQTFLN
jgi:hypothetical protein